MGGESASEENMVLDLLRERFPEYKDVGNPPADLSPAAADDFIRKYTEELKSSFKAETLPKGYTVKSKMYDLLFVSWLQNPLIRSSVEKLVNEVKKDQ